MTPPRRKKSSPSSPPPSTQRGIGKPNEVDTGEWVGIDRIQVQPANVFVLQAGPDSYILNFGFASPTIGSTPKSGVIVNAAGRILLTRGALNSLLEGLKDADTTEGGQE